MKKASLLKSIFIPLCVGFLSAPMFAQSGDLPPDARPGQCYAKCLIPDEYETVTEQIQIKDPATKLEVQPATYATVEEQIMTKEGYNILTVVPPSYTTVTEEVMVKEPSTRLEYIPAVFETVTEQVLVSPATTKWVKGKATPDCLSSNPEDCRVWCLKEVAAEYRTVTRKVLKSPATVRELEVPGQYKTVKRTVVQSPATVQEKTIPPEYKSIKKRVLESPATTIAKDIPAEYKTVTSRRLVNVGGFTEWREVLCDSQKNNTYISQIQRALKDRGYDPGPIDGVIGTQTRAAVRKFQTDNGLAVGVEGSSIPYETLKALGIQ